jgi:nucleoside-diphosphate-sugar epimerase
MLAAAEVEALPRVAITGGSGFIGSALAEQFGRNFEVTILDKKAPRLSNDSVQFVECDVTDFESVKRILEGADIVIHASIIQIPRINEERKLGYEVNVLGTQNVCEAVRLSRSVKGLMLVGSWHTIGEQRITGIVDEAFGLRPDMVEERARLYALSKMAQEAIVRLYDENSQDKPYGIVRIGTALGDNMPKKTAANIFIEQALTGKPLTPYEHSMYRPMLYADVRDVCKAFESYTLKILDGNVAASRDSFAHIVNVHYPEPITLLDLAEAVKESASRLSSGKLKPEIQIVKTTQPKLFTEIDKTNFKTNVTKARDFLGFEKFISPQESIDYIVDKRLRNIQS